MEDRKMSKEWYHEKLIDLLSYHTEQPGEILNGLSKEKRNMFRTNFYNGVEFAVFHMKNDGYLSKRTWELYGNYLSHRSSTNFSSRLKTSEDVEMAKAVLESMILDLKE